MFFFVVCHLIDSLVSFCYCIICSLDYDIWLPRWCLFVIVLFVLLWFTASVYPFGVFLLLYYLFFFGLRHLFAPLMSFCYCIICSSLGSSIWLPFGVFLLLYYLFFGLWHLIVPLVSFCYCITCSSLGSSIWLPFVIFLLLYYLFFSGLWDMIAHLVSFCYSIIC
jgi:hypothetical protein